VFPCFAPTRKKVLDSPPGRPTHSQTRIVCVNRCTTPLCAPQSAGWDRRATHQFSRLGLRDRCWSCQSSLCVFRGVALKICEENTRKPRGRRYALSSEKRRHCAMMTSFSSSARAINRAVHPRHFGGLLLRARAVRIRSRPVGCVSGLRIATVIDDTLPCSSIPDAKHNQRGTVAFIRATVQPVLAPDSTNKVITLLARRFFWVSSVRHKKGPRALERQP